MNETKTADLCSFAGWCMTGFAAFTLLLIVIPTAMLSENRYRAGIAITWMVLVLIAATLHLIAWRGRKEDDYRHYMHRQHMLLKALEKNDIRSIYRMASKKHCLWITEDILDWYASEKQPEDVKDLWKLLHENGKDPLPEEALDAWIRFRERGWKFYRKPYDIGFRNPGEYALSLMSENHVPTCDFEFYKKYADKHGCLEIPFSGLPEFYGKLTRQVQLADTEPETKKKK